MPNSSSVTPEDLDQEAYVPSPDLAQCLRNTVSTMIGEDEGLTLADGFEMAFVGVARQSGQSPIAVYDRDACIDILVCRDGMTEEGAEEHFQFNVEGAHFGEGTPAFIEQPRDDAPGWKTIADQWNQIAEKSF